MEQMRNPISVVEVIPLTVHNGDANAVLASDAIDMYQGPSYSTALVIAQLGTVGANVSALTLQVQEDDVDTFASATVAQGGAAVSVLAGESTFTFQVKRSKRYMRVVLTPTESGAADDIQIAVSAILSNWALPMNIR